jgi:superfamily II DNA or RNA helicase
MKFDKRRGYIASGRSYEIITGLAEESQDIIRVITGYFTIKGYNSVRRSFNGKKIALVVGVEDPGLDRARKVLVREIIYELAHGVDYERDDAVRELVDRINSGDVNILDARALDHHAKVYIFDSFAALVSSSNFTFRGLHLAEEAGLPTTEEIEVHGFISDFHDLYNRAYDITQELLLLLEEWLKMKSPWEVYLRTLFHLEDYPEVIAKTTNYRYPISYQKYLVKRAIIGIREYGGYLVVAQTGLGKTVIGTDVARQLHYSNEITHVMVIGPSPVEQEWKEHMLSAGIPCVYIVQQNLNFIDESQSGSLREFLHLADGYINQNWLIIVDESHLFRNRYKQSLNLHNKDKREEKLAHQRLWELVHQKNAKILLLTGTPYSTNVSDINDQLSLLPLSSSESLIDGFKDFLTKRKPRPWKITHPEELKDLEEVVSVLTTPTVIRTWALYDEEGYPYLKFGEFDRYFPRIMLKRINTPVFLPNIIEKLLSSDILRLRGQLIYDESSKKPINAHIIWSQRAGATKAWASSPYALKSRLENVISPLEDGEEKGYKYPSETRKQFIEPIIKNISELSFEEDEKVMYLVALLDQFLSEDRKIIIFCMYLSTICYIDEVLTELRPDWRIFSTARKSNSTYVNKPTKQVKDAIRSFAPHSNQGKFKKYNRTFDIFITSDKYGVGVNMQDADTVINYDLPWDAIAPHQRAGRILRPWKDPRMIEIYLFVATSLNRDSDYKGLENHWEKLVKRHKASQDLLDLPVLTESKVENVDMQNIGTLIEVGEIDYEVLGRIETNSSPIISRHMAVLEHNREEAKSIPDDIISALSADIEKPILFLLLQCNSQHHLVIYDIERQSFFAWKQTDILDLMACVPNTVKALVERHEIEHLANQCIKLWCKMKAIEPDEIMRLCTLYIKPHSSSDDFQDFYDQ